MYVSNISTIFLIVYTVYMAYYKYTVDTAQALGAHRALHVSLDR